MRRFPWAASAAGIVALLAMLAAGHGSATAFNNDVLLADAWKHGRNWVHFPGDYVDVMPFHGRGYVIEAPMPAILTFPAVLAFGLDANQTLVSNAIGALAVFGAWRLCQRAGLSLAMCAAASAFMFFGTSLFACSTVGSVWYLGHVCGACFSLLAIAECFGSRRAWLVAVWGLCAAFSRYPLFVALPLYAIVLLARSPHRKTIAAFVAPCVPAFAAWVAYNLNRFGTLTDPGFTLFYRIMDQRSKDQPKVFSLSYLPSQLQTYFATPPKVIGVPPWIVAPGFGLSLTFTSVPFLYALLAGGGIEALALWAATLATAAPALLYYGTGDVQYGVRHALDFEPYLFGLLALALARGPSRIVTVSLWLFAAFGALEASVWLLAPNLGQ